ncbi:PLP-dependent aspartate aminotransferase family protein [Nostocoides sp. HKS02]|uniref:trans-sulfuration enzyme family protein n=1 Tax=Nostocoides sp. HKS02 TaxID=1813880 RepID=UPI0012B4A912|nr:PLP-dependent aspartate aminotransferase family protein [Tetrasphaera sp. HKS02]QGN57861.1 cystathionine gamma-synthase [Tetrasphaera sp. HKS02]
MSHEDLSPATRVVALGRQHRMPGAGVNAPLEFSSTYVADGPVNYARGGNPTWSAFEEALGSLEGGDALVFASGMAAVAAAFSLVDHGAVVVAPRSAYSGTVATLLNAERDGRFEVRWVDTADTAATIVALQGADLVWFESPSNPLLEVADLPALAAAARAHDVISVCDNTFATPLVQQPLALGVDVVVHSVTKYLSGHSDLILGATVTGQTERGAALRERLAHHRLLGGAIAGPMETWLALRGLRTLHVRLERATANARELASRLSTHPAVDTVRYPGFGAIVSIEVPGGADGAERVAAATELWTHSTSLGGVESQLERRRRHAAEPTSVPDQLLRLSVGIEDVDDLWADLDRALRG